MLVFLTLTQRCQLQCIYCGSSTNADIEDIACHPPELTYDTKHLDKLKAVKDLVICFYGGEPLLQMGSIESVIQLLPNAIFCLQTNGLLLNKLNEKTLMRLNAILVSVDGDETTTDFNRGKGTYKKVIDNVKCIRAKGYKGDVIARMTVSEVCDIYNSVSHLLSLGLFDHVHWQLDCLWDSDMGARYKDFYGWRDKVYNPGITKLVELFMDNLRKGTVLGIVPFLGLLKSFIKGEKIKRIRCGAGSTAFNITTAGLVNACPIAPEFDPLADIADPKFNPHDLIDKKLVEGPCLTCPINDKCGGRCLYTNKTQWWGLEGHKAVCNTVWHLVSSLEKQVPEIKTMIANNKIKRALLEYPQYNNSCEIIP
jgi:putative peptide-modifying radical SAM enzyme